MTRQLEDWLQAYGEFTAESDSPQIFHMWCGLSAVAGAAQRKIFMEAAYFPVYSNMYVILVAPPGTAKKTSAMRTSKNILREIKPEVNFSTESGSFEGMVKMFQGIKNEVHQSLSIYSSELGSLMATNTAGMVDFLTDIYDGNADWSRSTVMHGTQTIKRPWLNMVAGTTPKWLGEKLGLIALEGGFIARCVLVYSEEEINEHPWPKMTPRLKRLKDALIIDLSRIATLEGEFQFEGGEEGEAFAWYSEWYKDHWEALGLEKSRFPAVKDPRTASYFVRKPIHLLKVAMLLSLTYKDDLLLNASDLLRAKAFLDYTEPGMRQSLNAVGKNEDSADTYMILSQIKNAGKISYAELLAENYSSLRYGMKSLDQKLEELTRMGFVLREGPLVVIRGPRSNGAS